MDQDQCQYVDDAVDVHETTKYKILVLHWYHRREEIFEAGKTRYRIGVTRDGDIQQ